MTITHILLDAGGVLLDETNQEVAMGQAAIQALRTIKPGYGWVDYVADRERAIHCFAPSVRRYILWRHTQPDLEQFERIEAMFQKQWRTGRPPIELMPGIDGEIRLLAERFKLLIAGQYGNEVLDLLQEHALLDCFAERFTQEDFAITKPDPRYLQQIAERAGASCEQCAMVGDRIDNDVVPAHHLGMRAVRIRVGIHAIQQPRTPDEIPDAELASVCGLADAICKLAEIHLS